MSGVTIRHCTFRVVRQGGWSWGGDRRGLVDRMTRIAPLVIGEWLAGQFAEDDETDLVEPLRLQVRLPRRALDDPNAFEAALRRALPTTPDAAFATAAGVDRRADGPQPIEHSADEHANTALPSTPEPPVGLAALLLRWRERAQLLHRLRSLPVPTAELWLERLAAQLPPGRASAQRRTDMSREIAAIRERIGQAMPDLVGDARADLATVVELLARHGAQLRAGDVAVLFASRSIADHATPNRARDRPETHTRMRTSPGHADRRAIPPLGDRAKVVPAVPLRRAATDADVRLTSVLPFLTLGMLARVGWLDVARASVEALALPDDGAILAAALADMLVPRHGTAAPSDRARAGTIAAFAGLAQAPSAMAFASWNGIAGDGLGALSAFVADEIAHGHEAEHPLLVTRLDRADKAWLLTDGDGGYPVAITASLPELLTHIDRFRASVLLIDRAAASPSLIAAFAARERCIVTDAQPARGEAGERLRGHAGLWCDPCDFPRGQIDAAAARFDEIRDSAKTVSDRLLGAALPDPLAHAAGLGAAMGLGLLAWTLWREREPPHVLLALDRLGSLDGTARMVGGALEIRPAVGRRYLDLKRAGALEPIAAVPWLEGRTIRFCGP